MAKPFLSRRQFLQLLALSGIGLTIGAIPFYEATNLSVERFKFFTSKAPQNFHLKIAFLTDIHWKEPFSPKSLLEKAIQICQEFEPDLILFGGDYISNKKIELEPLLEILTNFQAPLGKFGCLGNHDRIVFHSHQLRQKFLTAGIEILANQGKVIPHSVSPFYLAGLDSIWIGHPNCKKAFANAPNNIPSLLLCHEPDYWDNVLKLPEPACLTLAGHTHGGQCRIPLVDWTPVTVASGEKYIRGPFYAQNSTLYVSRGLGTTSLPIRFACPPEITLIDWYGKAPIL